MWLNPYVEQFYSYDNFKVDIDRIWNEMKPFYVQLHAYVRYKLRQINDYDKNIGEDGLIPAHILGIV